MVMIPRFIFSCLDAVENIGYYRPGGYPISIGHNL
jgi:hypothetical protein